MKKYTSPEGWNLEFYSKAEQEATWRQIEKDISPVGKNVPLFTPQDNLKYYIISETEVGETGMKIRAIIKAAGKRASVTAGIENIQERIENRVRKLYNS